MTNYPWPSPRTAEQANSIWRDVPEDAFRQHLVSLQERTNAVPTNPQIFSISERQSQGGSKINGRILNIKTEHQLADDFALLAAVEEGAPSVSAACFEEHTDGQGMTVVFAAMDAFKPKHQDAIQGLCNVLTHFAKRFTRAGLANCEYAVSLRELRGRIVRLHRDRIIARLRSVKWQRPRYLSESHKKPLWKDFTNLIHRAQFLYSKRERRSRWAIEVRLRKLAGLYEWFEELEGDPASEIKHLLRIAEESHGLCISAGMKSYVQKLEGVRATAQVASALKCVRQIEKIAAYWRIPRSILDSAETHQSLFSKMELQFLPSYASIPTSISYESWAKTCHVHAEVQLAVYYDLHQGGHKLRPRVIGTSKYMCFLCLLFIKAHARFFPANTHGRLYDQWTIPDLAEFDHGQVDAYRRIINIIDREITELAKLEPIWRPEPMTSRQDLSLLNDVAAPAWIGSGKIILKPFAYADHDSDVDESAVVLPFVKRTLR